jgi:hypothetical protein
MKNKDFVAGGGLGREAGFSATLLAKSTISFGRNDDSRGDGREVARDKKAYPRG